MSPIHIACFFDKAFAWPALVMAAFLSRNSRPDRPTILHVFHIGDLGLDLKARLAVLRTPSFSYEVEEIGNPFGPDLPIPHDNPTYYLRLMLGDLLDVDRVIYLDVDIITRTDLAALFDFDLGGKTIAAAPDPAVGRAVAEAPRSQTLFLSSVVIRTYIEGIVEASHVYFNSGVMLIDLARWRALGVKARAFDHMRGRYHVLFADQDIINHVLQGDVAYLGTEWNCMPALQPDADCGDARILHFAGYKPFNYKDQPQKSDALYWDFAMSTPYGARLRHEFYMSYFWDLRALRRQLKKVPSRYAPRAIASRLFGRVATLR